MSEIPTKDYFFGYVPNIVLRELKILSIIIQHRDLEMEIYKKSIELGYNKEDSDEAKRRIEKNLFYYPNIKQFEVETIEKKYYMQALSIIAQEMIQNKELLSEQIESMDYILTRYDPYTTNSYLNKKPKEILIPTFDSKNWLSKLKSELKHTLQYTENWITLYAKSTFNFINIISPHGSEEIEFITAFSDHDVQKYTDVEKYDLFQIPYSKTIEEFKNLEIYSVKNSTLLPFLLVRETSRIFFQNNILVKVDKNFQQNANLVWSKYNLLDMTNNDSTVIRYQLWVAPYNDETQSRSRIGWGVRLQIDKDFLINYLNRFHSNLFILYTKTRTLDNGSDTNDEHSEICDHTIFTTSMLQQLKNNTEEAIK